MRKLQQGYIALISVLIISAVTLALASTVGLLGIGEAQSSLSFSKGEDALQLAEGCMEDALLKAQQSSSYSGGNITRPEGTCIIAVAKNGNNWTITATSSQQDYNRTVQTQFTRVSGSPITMNSWQEVLSVLTPTPISNPMCTPPNCYSISGNIYNDSNNNQHYDPPGETFSSGNNGCVIVKDNNGNTVWSQGNVTNSYTTGAILPAGNYSVSYSNLPSGHTMSYPLDVPPSYAVTVGPNCTTNGVNDAFCSP